jgi:hypothetical protein
LLCKHQLSQEPLYHYIITTHPSHPATLSGHPVWAYTMVTLPFYFSLTCYLLHLPPYDVSSAREQSSHYKPQLQQQVLYKYILNE